MWVPGRPLLMLRRVQPNHVDAILDGLEHGALPPDEIVLCKIEEWDHLTGHVKYGQGYPDVPAWNDVPFFHGQVKIVLRNCGLINPDDIEEYVAIGGYQALYKVLIDQNPAGGHRADQGGQAARPRRRRLPDRQQVGVPRQGGRAGQGPRLQRGRGRPRRLHEPQRDRVRPARAARGHAHRGLRHRRPAGDHLRPRGVPARRPAPRAGHRAGARLRGPGRQRPGPRLRLRHPARRGRRRLRVRRGDRPHRVARGPGRAGRGRDRPSRPRRACTASPPTSTTSRPGTTSRRSSPGARRGSRRRAAPRAPGPRSSRSSGKVRSTGLVEMPLGTPLATFIYDIGEGGTNGRDIKAVQTGGPVGRLHPRGHVRHAGRLRDARPARLDHGLGRHGRHGRRQLHGRRRPLLHRVHPLGELRQVRPVPGRPGQGAPACSTGSPTARRPTTDIAALDELCRMVRDTSLCGLGQSAPNPVLTSLRHFRHEFEDHFVAKRCRAGVCEDLALSPCENSCPLHMNIPRFLQLYQEGRLEDAFLSVILDNPLPASTGRVCQHPCDNRCRRAAIDEPVNMRDVHRLIADEVLLSDRFERWSSGSVERRLEPTGREVAVVGAGPDRPRLRLLPRPARPQRRGLRLPARRGRHAALRAARVPAAEGGARPRDRADRAPGRALPVQRQRRRRRSPSTTSPHQYDAVFLAIGTWKEAWVYLPGHRARGRHPGAAVPGGRRARARRCRSGAASSSSAAATRPSTRPAPRAGWVPTSRSSTAASARTCRRSPRRSRRPSTRARRSPTSRPPTGSSATRTAASVRSRRSARGPASSTPPVGAARCPPTR